MPIEGIKSIAQNPGWLKTELTGLRDKTMLLFFVSLFFTGILLGFFVVSDIFDVVNNPVKKVSHAYAGDSVLKVEVETKEPVIAFVEYGTSEEVLNEIPVGAEYSYNHKISIEGLLPEKPHAFRLVLKDSRGDTHISDFFVAE